MELDSRPCACGSGLRVADFYQAWLIQTENLGYCQCDDGGNFDMLKWRYRIMEAGWPGEAGSERALWESVK